MVTKYDVFEYMYNRGSALKPGEIANAFWKGRSEYHSIYNLLLELKKGSIVSKNGHWFQAIRSGKNDRLYHLIKFCISNKINYNDLLDAKITTFIASALLKDKFTVKDFNLNPRTLRKYIDALSKYGLLIILSRKPLVATIPHNTFLRDLLFYFGHRVPAAKYKGDEYISEIEREMGKFRRLSKRNYKRYLDILEDYEIRFIHHSLSLEGNPITLPETVKILKENIIPSGLSVASVQEVQNYQSAIRLMIRESEEKRPLTKASILNYHYLAMQHNPVIAGRIRVVPVFIKRNPHFKTADVAQIEPKLNGLLDKYNLFMKNKNNTLRSIIAFSAYFHNEFQHIHPFEDGNSRTSRLITFHLLRTQDIPVLDIPLGLLEEYLSNSKGAKKRDDKKLSILLQRIILYNIKAINERLS